MIHRILTCKNHPNLRWSTKDIAWTEGVGYNGCRNISFCGQPTGEGMFHDNSGLKCSTFIDDKVIEECPCPSRDLILAPEDQLVHRGDII